MFISLDFLFQIDSSRSSLRTETEPLRMLEFMCSNKVISVDLLNAFDS